MPTSRKVGISLPMPFPEKNINGINFHTTQLYSKEAPMNKKHYDPHHPLS
jgi:hypothetical protein